MSVGEVKELTFIAICIIPFPEFANVEWVFINKILSTNQKQNNQKKIYRFWHWSLQGLSVCLCFSRYVVWPLVSCRNFIAGLFGQGSPKCSMVVSRCGGVTLPEGLWEHYDITLSSVKIIMSSTMQVSFRLNSSVLIGHLDILHGGSNQGDITPSSNPAPSKTHIPKHSGTQSPAPSRGSMWDRRSPTQLPYDYQAAFGTILGAW